MDEIQETAPVKKSRRVVADVSASAEKTEAPKKTTRAKAVKADESEPKAEKVVAEKSADAGESRSNDSGESSERSGNNNRNRNRNRNGRNSGHSGNGIQDRPDKHSAR